MFNRQSPNVIDALEEYVQELDAGGDRQKAFQKVLGSPFRLGFELTL